MGDINLKTALGGQIALTPTNTASNYTVTVPAATGTVLLAGATNPTGNLTLTTPSTTTAAYLNWTNGTGTVASIGGYSDSTTTGHLEFYTLASGTTPTEQARIPSTGGFQINSSGGGSVLLSPASTASAYTLTLPARTGTAITSADTATVTPTMLSQPITSGTLTNSTSGTAIDFTGIPSWVKQITIMLNGVGSTPQSNSFIVQIGSGSVDTTGYTSAGYFLISQASNGFQSQSTGFNFYYVGTNSTRYATFTLSLIGSNTWISTVNGYTVYTGTPGCVIGAGAKVLSGALDRVRLTSVGGGETFNAGSVNIIYQ